VLGGWLWGGEGSTLRKLVCGPGRQQSVVDTVLSGLVWAPGLRHLSLSGFHVEDPTSLASLARLDGLEELAIRHLELPEDSFVLLWFCLGSPGSGTDG
jgi:hypothetical protein